jgi:hypothetical protein
MSTRSAIIRKTEDGYEGVYCHFDGHIDSVGKRLYDFYNHPEQVKELLALGDLSSLGETLKSTIAYHRDRNEDFALHQGKTVKEVEDQIGHNGYVYVYDGFWTVNGVPLSEKLAEIGMKSHE